MSSPDKPGDEGGGPGLLEDDDLRNELEAWDRTFDALHDDDGLQATFAAVEAAAIPGTDDEDVTSTLALAGSGPVPVQLPSMPSMPTAKASPPPAAPPRFIPPPPRASTPVRVPPAPVRTTAAVVPRATVPARSVPAAAKTPPAKAPPVTPARPPTAPPGEVDETDFSDLGFDGPPEALGSLLGQPPPLPSLEEVAEVPLIDPLGFDDDEVFTSAVRPGAAHMPGPERDADDEPLISIGDDGPPAPDVTRVAEVPAELLAADETMDRVRRTTEQLDDGDDASVPWRDPSDDTFDKINRTKVLSPDDDLLASARGGGPAGAPARPRGPAIVRRGTERPVEPVRRPADDDDDFGGFGGSESTRVADVSEIERLASGPDAVRAAAPAPARGKRESFGGFGPESTRVADVGLIERLARERAPGAPVEDDPYDDIEIGGDEEHSNSDATPSSAGKRLTRHVVRRAAPEAVRGDEHVLELDADDAPPPRLPRPRSAEPARTAAGSLDDAFAGLDALGEARPVEAAVVADLEPAPVAVEIGTATPPPVIDLDAGGPDALDDDIFGDLEPTAGVPAEDAGAGAVAPGVDAALEALMVDEAAAPVASAAPVELPEGPTRVRPRTIPPGPPPGAASGPVAVDPVAAAPVAVEPVAAASGPVAAPVVAAIDPAAFADEPIARTQLGVPPPPPMARARTTSAPPPPAAPAPIVDAPADVAVAPAPIDTAPELPPPVFGDDLPALDLDALAVPDQVDPATGWDPGEEAARAILVLERELELIDEPAQVATLRVEAGRLYERLGDADRARVSYEAALLADPRATAALRGLRRIARGAGDLPDATRHLDAELGIAGPLERRALALHRVDLLMAAGEQDLARVAVGELLDEAKGDVRAQLAQLELAFLDGRADELGESLDRLAGVLADPALRAAVEVARGHLAERGGDRAGARQAFDAAVAGDAAARAPWLGSLRVAAAAEWGTIAGALAGSVADPAVAAALAIRSSRLAPAPAGATGDHPARAALSAAAAIAPADPLVQAAVAGDAIGHGELSPLVLAVADGAADPALRRQAALWAAARLPATNDPDADRAAQLGLYSAALAAEPTDDLAAAALTERWLAAGDLASAAELLAVRAGAGASGEHDRVGAATLLVAAGRPAEAAALLPEPAAPGAVASPAAADAWAGVLRATGRAADVAAMFQQLAAREESDERIDGRLWTAKAAVALDRAADPADRDAILAALQGWGRVIELDGDVERAHARAVTMAAALGDPDILADTVARAQAAQPPAAAGTMVVVRARAAASGDAPDWARADEILRELPADDPRRLATQLALAARAGRWGDAALALEDHAAAIAARAPMQAALARYRAAGLYLDKVDNPAQAVSLLQQLADDHPELGFVLDLLGSARRRLGDAAPPSRAGRAAVGTGADAFARLVRDADQAAAQGDALAALALYGKALEIRPQDPLAAEPLGRVAFAVREAGPVGALVLADLRLAETTGDDAACADAYEALGRIDRDLRDDAASALVAFESAAAAAPGRHAVLRALERAYAADGRWADLAALRVRQVAALPALDPAAADPHGAGDDAVALALERAQLLERLEASDDELRAAYQAVVDRAPRARRALFHLEALVRRGGSSPELAALEASIADYFADVPRTRGAFLTRGGETLTDLGRLDEALTRFKAADELRGGYVAALAGWRDAALRGQLWADFADAAGREAALTDEPAARARLHHLAGVALMDKALAGERAADALRAALDADPRHVDAFVRLRLLLDEQGEHDALATLLEQRLEVEDDRGEQIALHRAIAELARNMLEDRERAKRHFRAIAEASPTDLRAIAALSDIAWEQGAWGECAEVLRARARLEREPHVLRNIFFRLGVIFAERLPDPAEAIKAFQRVLSYDPDDEAALERMADLGIATRQWKMALGACERLVKNEQVPARKVAHLHRVGTIFADGFGDRRRAERAYQLAVDAAPDSDVALGALIKFYEDAGDTASIRVHLGLVAASMRQRIAAGADGNAFRVLARIARARHDAGVRGQAAVTRAASDIAALLGADGGEPVAPGAVALGALVRPEADELLWPKAVTPELRQIFALLGDRVAKHVGIDLRPYGVTRGDRVRARDSAVAAAAQEVAESLGLGEIDLYVSARQPFAMVAEPTSPLSLVLGSRLADPDRLASVRFAAAGALRLAHAQLAIPARLPADDLGVLVVALLRLFQPDFAYLAIDNDQVIAQQQRLRRLIPSNLMAELRPYALAVSPQQFDHRVLARDLEVAALRAGLLAAGGAAAPLQVLMARAGVDDLAAGLQVPVIGELVQYAISEDFAALAALAGG
ncbi:MAG TPA: hypothetical protein VM734_19110 [Kofleriaceae bacterium]|nr:hypothetical protein [Kofleriaceae bacterium]